MRRGSRGKVEVDWHGHMDRGLGVINNIAAIEAGADRLHGTALGIGERAGNAPLDITMVNLKLMGWIDQDLTKLGRYVKHGAEICGFDIPSTYPVFGDDAFETGTGVHAAAVIKAINRDDTWLANRVYSGVPADEFGLHQKIGIGPMSGKSNVIFWLRANGFDVDRQRRGRGLQRRQGLRPHAHRRADRRHRSRTRGVESYRSRGEPAMKVASSGSSC